MADDADDVRFFPTQNLIIYGDEVSRSQGFMGMELPDWQLLFQVRSRLAGPYIGTDQSAVFPSGHHDAAQEPSKRPDSSLFPSILSAYPAFLKKRAVPFRGALNKDT